jgi:hypothetical protein
VIDAPTMEVVRFEEPLAILIPSPVETDMATVGLLGGADFANTTRGASPGSMETDIIPTSPGAFVQHTSKPLHPTALASPLMS